MTITTVSSVTGLTAALKTAHAGDTIQLMQGNYSGVTINNLNFSSPVTITSASTSHQATLVGLKVTSSSGLTFSNLDLTSVGSTDPYYPFRVATSQNITFTGLNVHGDASAQASTQLWGFYVSGSSGVTFTNSSFSHEWAGITANNDTNVVISNNTFSYLDKGGIEMGGSSNVVLSNNYFTDFQVSAGEHSDAIQLYTAGTTSVASNITISNNEYYRGTGDAAQGIFVQDEVGTLPFNDLSITNNTIVGGYWNSVYVNANVTGTLNVSNNFVESWAGVDMAGTGGASAAQATTFGTTAFLGRISLLGNLSGATVTETGNTAQGYIGTGGVTIPTPAGNTTVGTVGALTSTASLATPVHASAEAAPVSEFKSVGGSALTGDTGSSLYLADVGAGSKGQTVVSAGSTYAGTYGTLTIDPNGSYSYTETKQGLVIGQVYDDHFTTTVASSTGQATSSTLDFLVTGSGVGNGATDLIVGGAGAETISNFGARSNITAGSGPDIFVFGGVATSTPSAQTLIQGFKSNDLIDLSGVDSHFHIVSRYDHHANELLISHVSGGSWEIYGYVTGGALPDFQIHLTGVTAAALTAGNFII
jgi:VCBS repeat-containing protein/parallel beta-helix repeat protein